VSDLTFAQPDRRNFALPILLALGVLAVAAGLLAYFFPYKKPQVALTHSTIYIGHTVFEKQNFQNGTKVVGQGPSTEDDLYVIATVHIQNPLKVPLTLNDFTATLTGADGSQMQTSGVEKNQLDSVFIAFPELKPMTGTPLLRETVIAPGQSADGTILFQLPVAKTTWDQRQSATFSIDFYRESPVLVTIPKN
jgi:Domain of unknown function (DUF4352)